MGTLVKTWSGFPTKGSLLLMSPNPRIWAHLAPLYASQPPAVQRLARALAECGGRYTLASALAHDAGLLDRDVVYRILHNARLPPLTEMAALIRALNWAFELADGKTLARLASDEQREPAQYRRDVRRWLGVRWAEFVGLGPDWVAKRIAERVQVP